MKCQKDRIAFAVICDGMGGLEYGEIASRITVLEFNRWFLYPFTQLVSGHFFAGRKIFRQWKAMIQRLNDRMVENAQVNNVNMGTTLSAIFIYKKRYFLCHVGDSRIYKIRRTGKQLTVDHTWVQQEVKRGKLSKKEAAEDPRKNILVQCVGVNHSISPQFKKGILKKNTTFLLASDGLSHTVSQKELFRMFRPDKKDTNASLEEKCQHIVMRAKNEGEQDNISVIAVSIH